MKNRVKFHELFQFLDVYIHANVDQEESLEQQDAVIVKLDEEADNSLVNVAREEGAFALKLDDGKEGIHKK